MFRFMKKQAKVNDKINEKQREAIEKILDEQIAAADAADKEGNWGITHYTLLITHYSLHSLGDRRNDTMVDG